MRARSQINHLKTISQQKILIDFLCNSYENYHYLLKNIITARLLAIVQ